MKKSWFILLICFVLMLSGCKTQKPQDDEIAGVITEENDSPTDEGTNEEAPPAEEKDEDESQIAVEPPKDEYFEDQFISDTDGSYYVSYIGDGFVVLSSWLNSIKIKFYTDLKYLKEYDSCKLTSNLYVLKEEQTFDEKGPVVYVAKDVEKAEFAFDPSNLNADGRIRYIGEDYFIISYIRRGLKVYVDDISEYCINDYVDVVGSATAIDPYIFEDTAEDIEVGFEMRGAEITIDEDVDAIKGAKPVIYLYPEEETNVKVNVTLDGGLTCVYPEYNGGWEVTATPDGTLFDKNGREYYCLYWEGEFNKPLVYDKNVGFVVKGSDTAEFLREKLLYLGLNEREANEFIIYWLPQMEDNNYNYIYFSEEEYEAVAKLDIAPNPDTLIRIMMVWEPLESPREVTEQKLKKAPERKGFTAVEWGGSRIG